MHTVWFLGEKNISDFLFLSPNVENHFLLIALWEIKFHKA